MNRKVARLIEQGNKVLANMRYESPISEAHIRALHWAVREAATWKGSLHPEDYPEFDAKIARCKQALRAVRNDKRMIEGLH